MATQIFQPESVAIVTPVAGIFRRILANPLVRLGGSVLLLLIVMAIFAPWLGTIDPTAMDPVSANLLPWTRAEFNSLTGEVFTHHFYMGSDSLGRDIYSRVIFGSRISLTIGISVALIAVVLGMPLGLISGYFRRVDSVIMRTMDGVMAIPSMLFAISLVALFGGNLLTVVLAIAIPEVPRVARLVRSVVLSIRDEAYVEAALMLGTPIRKIIWRHILPNAAAPLIIQGTYICATAILVEAILSFLGVGLPAEMATWGNIMAEGRAQFNQYPHNVWFPGLFLALTVLAVNILGDGLRDTLDPRFNKRGG
ncbi:ABC transporter permease [Brenneria goodwinii]|uniref:ABC transporter permease n=1 Tax=Brenneria goodwinii TaxID=1109412 RepID=UPI000EF180BD|nr:ABC transporter permease [Brenneria goodwinii]MCG8157561.1 ABC transporter permease [Brenneria goodwinii]MCG8161954.1 ABC transporter permease [Brenneria goodwinii]MCG8166751.1 ABC transporter permease [Brenneria goodwinii]MCG8171210.1 ABC transporter permease [Brenneria goodwinii]MCG8176292.1 ABC transporter permease [Brenneria goodwinii]